MFSEEIQNTCQNYLCYYYYYNSFRDMYAVRISCDAIAVVAFLLLLLLLFFFSPPHSTSVVHHVFEISIDKLHW